MKRLAIIPARGGSKGVPGKNIRPLGGKPLLGYAVEAAAASSCFDRILVSTDDERIADVARRLGAEAPWLRPANLATDSASVVDAALHELDRLAAEQRYAPDVVVLLQPTSPFRSAASIRAALLLHDATVEGVVSVSPAPAHPYWCKKLDEKGLLHDFLDGVAVPSARQELPPAFALDGGLYARTTESLRRRRSFHAGPLKAWLTPAAESLDIDTEQDWEHAEFLLARRARAAA